MKAFALRGQPWALPPSLATPEQPRFLRRPAQTEGCSAARGFRPGPFGGGAG